MSDASAQLHRLLDLIPRCADDQPHSVEEIAAEVGTTPATLLRDLRALSERFDTPGGFVEGVQIYVERKQFEVRSDHFRRPMRLTAGELGALELGLGMIARERPLEEQHAIEGARQRLRSALTQVPSGDPLGGTQDAALAETAGDDARAVLREALRQERMVQIRYLKPGDTHAGDRTVGPLGLVHNRGWWYLVALTKADQAVRVFRCDRVGSAEVLEEPFVAPEGVSLDAIHQSGPMFTGDPEEALVLRFGKASARWIAEREGLSLAADGTVTVEYPLGDREWAVGFVLGYRGDVTVLGPDTIHQEVVRRLEALLAAQ